MATVPIAVLLPDLIITAATAPTSIKPGDTVNLTWTVMNQGPGTAQLPFVKAFLSNDPTLKNSGWDIGGKQATVDLASGASATFSVNVTIAQFVPQGSFLVLVADYYDHDTELDETNNLFVVPLIAPVVTRADLVVSAVTAPLALTIGSTTALGWTVTNRGDATASSDWNDAIYLSADDKLDNTDIRIDQHSAAAQSPLAVGSAYSFTDQVTILGGLSGPAFLLFVANDSRNQSESDTTNNVRATPVTVSGADLVVSGATAPTTPIELGSSFDVAWTVRNQGTSTAAADWSDYVYFSTDATLDSSDTLLRSEPITVQTPLEPGGSYSLSRTLTASNTLPGGAGYLLFAADRTGNQAETSENNNVRAVPITLLAPDIVVTDVVITPPTAVGQPMTVTWTVKNQGAATANAHWNDYVYFSDNAVLDNPDSAVAVVSNSTQPPLAPDASYTASTTFTPGSTRAGWRYVIVNPSTFLAQGESDTTNNTKAVAFELLAPDLIVTAATAPGTVVAGADVTVSWTVTNIGNASALADWTDRVTLGGTALASEPIATQTPLAPGASYTITRSVHIPEATNAGSSSLTFSADDSSQQRENEDSPNSLTLPIQVLAPDLVVTSATAPTSMRQGDTVSVTWTVMNQSSDIDAFADWSDYVYLSSTSDASTGSDTRLAIQAITTQTPLAPGGSYTVTAQVTITDNIGGSAYFKFVADGTGQQGDSNNSNNILVVPTSVSAPDLIVSAASSVSEAAPGQSIVVNWTVSNPSAFPARADWTDAIYLSNDAIFTSSDTFLGQQSIQAQTPLAANGSYTISRTVTLSSSLTSGSRFLLVVADRFGNQGESDETNNVLAIPLTILRPDLVVTAANAPPSAIVSDSIAVSWTVQNQSNVTALADWSDAVYLSKDGVVSSDDARIASQTIQTQTPLPGAASYTISRNITLPAAAQGNYFLIFAANDSRQQAETVSTNNFGVIPITLQAPDLVVTAASAPSEITLGQAFNVAWTVTNQGTVTAPADWFDGVYLSSDETVDSSDTLLNSESITSQTPLGSGASYVVQRTLNSSVGLGDTRFLLFVTDRDNRQGETNETNNIRAVPITVRGPDLAASAVTAVSSAYSGQDVSVTWTITNVGNVDATGTWNDTIYLAADHNGSQPAALGSYAFTGTIAAGASIQRTQTVTLPLNLRGTFYLEVGVDSGNTLPETSEKNNVAIADNAFVVHLSAFPNLQVSSVTAPPTAFSSQQTLVQWNVTNTGDGPTGTPFWYDGVWLSQNLTLDGNDVFLGEVLNASYLAAGDSYHNQLTVTLPAGIEGPYHFLVVTDRTNRVYELERDGDNITASAETLVQITPPPDLRVDSVNAPSQAFSGTTAVVTWTTSNAGVGRTAEAAWYDDVYLSVDDSLSSNDLALGSVFRSGALLPGESYASTLTANLPIGISGSYFVIVKTDGRNHVYEHAFEGNNVTSSSSINIRLTPPPDLEVTAITVPSDGVASHPLALTYEIINAGSTVTPNNSWVDSFYLSPTATFDSATAVLLGSRQHFGALTPGGPILDPGAAGAGGYRSTVTLTLPNALSGTYYLFIATDTNGEVFELDNDNNRAGSINTIAIVSRPPDLVVTSAVAPSTATSGSQVRVDWKVTNTGTGDSVATSWVDRFYASTDATFDANDILLGEARWNGLLDAGASYSSFTALDVPFELAGTFNLFVVADAADAVFENGQDGNNASNAIPITFIRQMPDLQVTSANAPSAVVAGATLDVDWNVTNSGTGTTNANYWYDNVYLSVDGIVSNDDFLIGSYRRTNPLTGGEGYAGHGSFVVPANVPLGTYQLWLRLDANGQVTEASETNNIHAIATVNVNAAPPLPFDLVLDAVDAPFGAISGQPMQLSWTVRNAGVAVAGQWYDAVYLSLDETLDRQSDFYLGFVDRTGGLAAGASYTGQATFTLPQGLAGPFFVFVAADSGNQIAGEINENNNINHDADEMFVSLQPPADLVAGTITIPVSAVAGQPVTLSYSVSNQGTSAALGSWYDAIYLSADDHWDVGDVLFGRVLHQGSVSAGASYSEILTAPLPAVRPGDYRVIVRSDIRNQIQELSETNNLSASVDQVDVTVPALTLGQPVQGTLSAGQSAYYRVDVDAGEALVVTLDGQSATASNELYVRYGTLPTRGEFDFIYSQPFAPDQRVLVSTTKAGTYYILAYGHAAEGSPNFTLTAKTVQFTVFDTTYGKGGTAGNRTIEINGAKFDRTVTASLRDASGTEYAAVDYYRVDETKLYATFDLTHVPVGTYDVVLRKGTEGVVVASGLEVVTAPPSAIQTSIDTPDAVRRPIHDPAQVMQFRVGWANTGLNDIVAPLLQIRSSAPIGLTPDPASAVVSVEPTIFGPGSTLSGSSLTVFGSKRGDGPAGIILPGQGEVLTLYALVDVSLDDINLSVDVLGHDAAEAFDWEGWRSFMRPSGMLDSAFQPIFEQVVRQVGPTWGDFLSMLSRNANVLGETIREDVSALLSLEVERARAALSLSITGYLRAADWSTHLSDRMVTAINTATKEEFTTRSRADGSFSFFELPLGSYELRVFEGLLNTGTTPAVELTSAARSASVELILQATGNVLGSVHDAANGLPIAGALVWAVASDGQTYRTITDEDGSYAFNTLPLGHAALTVSAAGKATILPTDIEVTSAGAVQLLAMFAEGSITGVISVPNGASGQTILVAAYSSTAPDTSISTTTVTAGETFTLGRLPSGTFLLRFLGNRSRPDLAERWVVG